MKSKFLDITRENNLDARYQRATTLLQGAAALFQRAGGPHALAFNTFVIPHWIGDCDCFWYQQCSSKGHCYRLVDALS